MQIENDIKKIATDYFNVSEDKVKVDHRFKGGMSNYTYLVYVEDMPYVIRKIGSKGEVIVNPKNEKQHLELVSSLNITSNTLFLNEDNGDKVSTYLEGEILSGNITENDYLEVSNILKTLHQSKITGNDYELKDRLRRYEKLLSNKVCLKYYELKLMWLKLYDENYINSKKVFCHGDAQRSNIIRTKDGIKLLDFEFSGMNDPFYDIASFGNISFDDSLKLLDYYLDFKTTKEDINKLRFYRMYQVLQWHIVASYKDEVGLSELLNLDFNLIAEKYLKFAEELYLKIMESYDNN